MDDAKESKNTTKKLEWLGWTGSVSWLFFMMYGHDRFVYGNSTIDDNTWPPFFFMVVFALSIAFFGWRFGQHPNELARVAFFLTPAAVAATAVFALLPEPFGPALYIASPVLMAPALTRRVYGIVRTAEPNRRLTRYMSGTVVCAAWYTVWIISNPPGEIAFLTPALMAVLAWLGIRRNISVGSRPKKASLKPSKKMLAMFAVALFMFMWLNNGQSLIHTLLLFVAEEVASVFFTVMVLILPPLGSLVFAAMSDRGHERTGLVCGMSLFLIGIWFAVMPEDSDGLLVMSLVVAQSLGNAYCEFFILTAPLFLFDRTNRPVFVASLGVVLKLALSALDWHWILYSWIPEDFLRLDTLIVSYVVVGVVFVVLALVLFERHREKSLAAALYAMMYKEEEKKEELPIAEEAQKDAVAQGLFSPGEKDVALLLIEGISQRDIARRLHIPAGEVGRYMDALREKLGAREDPAISAAVKKYRLTGREADMLVCLKEGKTNLGIADQYFLSEQTVKNYIHSLMKKLPVENRAAIAGWLDSFEDTTFK